MDSLTWQSYSRLRLGEKICKVSPLKWCHRYVRDILLPCAHMGQRVIIQLWPKLSPLNLHFAEGSRLWSRLWRGCYKRNNYFQRRNSVPNVTGLSGNAKLYVNWLFSKIPLRLLWISEWWLDYEFCCKTLMHRYRYTWMIQICPGVRKQMALAADSQWHETDGNGRAVDG